MTTRAFCLLLLCLLAAAPASAATYNVTALGTLSGGVSSTATALNDIGDVVGYTSYSGNSSQAFIWTSTGGIQAIGAAGPQGQNQANGINNSDSVVGIAGGQAFRWDSTNGLVLLDATHGGTANAVNNSGTVIGSRNSGGSRTIVWSSANTISNPFPVQNTQGYAINNLGQLAGQQLSGTGGYYSDGASFVSLGGFLPEAMNDSRGIAGSISGVAALHFIDTNSTTTIGKLSPSDTSSNSLAINNAGTAVGVSVGTGGFVYDPTNGLQSLTQELAPAFNGWSILSASGINNSGQIAGIGLFNGQQEAVLLTPVPEPSSIAIAAIGVALLVAWRRRIGR